MSVANFGTFLPLAEALKAQGWEIVKYEDLGYGVTLTIIPKKQQTAEAEQWDTP